MTLPDPLGKCFSVTHELEKLHAGQVDFTTQRGRMGSKSSRSKVRFKSWTSTFKLLSLNTDFFHSQNGNNKYLLSSYKISH